VRILWSVLLSAFVSHFVLAEDLVGTWKSDCQDVENTAGYSSLAPVDIFREDGTATLFVHVYEKNGCTGKEWDEETIPCKYKIGNAVSGINGAKELDLACTVDGSVVNWYELEKINGNLLLYGNKTGMTPADRPTQLGNIYYRRQ
jgi:hypothetical protein